MACRSLVAFDTATTAYPGGDPSSPPPTSDQVKQWATTAAPTFDGLAKNAPAALDPAVATVRAALDGAGKGAPVNTEDPVLTHATTAIDKWGHDNCGFSRLDVVGTGKDVPGVPATLPVGPVSFSFSNGGSTDKGFVLLIAKVKDGAQYTLDGIRSGAVDGFAISDLVGAAQPTAEEPTAFGSAALTAGKYLVLSPLGTPPAFTGTAVAEFEVR